MTQPATTLPLTPRERLRWRRAMDALLIESIYGRAIRDVPLPAHEPIAAAAMAAVAEREPSIATA